MRGYYGTARNPVRNSGKNLDDRSYPEVEKVANRIRLAYPNARKMRQKTAAAPDPIAGYAPDKSVACKRRYASGDAKEAVRRNLMNTSTTLFVLV